MLPKEKREDVPLKGVQYDILYKLLFSRGFYFSRLIAMPDPYLASLSVFAYVLV